MNGFLETLLILPAQLIDDFIADPFACFGHSIKLLLEPLQLGVHFAPLAVPGILSLLHLLLQRFLIPLQISKFGLRGVRRSSRNLVALDLGLGLNEGLLKLSCMIIELAA